MIGNQVINAVGKLSPETAERLRAFIDVTGEEKLGVIAALMTLCPPGVHTTLGGTVERIFEILMNTIIGLPFREPGEYQEMFLKSWINGKSFVNLMGMSGISVQPMDYSQLMVTQANADGKLFVNPGLLKLGDPIHSALLRSKAEWPRGNELNTLWNRGLITDEAADTFMRYGGVVDANIRKVLGELRFEIPSMGDLIRYAVRHAFDVDVVERFKYLDEIPTQLYDLAAANGFGGKTGVQYPAGKDNKGGVVAGHEAKWFDMEWVSHWILPSVGEGYSMLHRLYDQSRFGPSPIVTDETKFTPEDQKLLMRANDIPPFWRDRLIALSYLPITRVDIRRLYQSKILKREGVYHAYRANGYDDSTAWLLTQYTEKQALDAEKKKLQGPAVKLICQSYQIGIIDHDTAVSQMTEILEDADSANLEMSQCDLQDQINTTKKMLELLRRRYIKGHASRDQTMQSLNGMGIQLDKANKYLDQWDIDLELIGDKIVASEITKWYVKGLLSKDEAFIRLVQIGYSRPDATNILLVADEEIARNQMKAIQGRVKDYEANLKRQKQIAKQIQADAKAEKKANVAAVKAAAKERVDLIKAQLKGISTKNLKAWFVDKFINENQLRGYLALMNWGPNIIDLWVEQLKKEIAGQAEQAPSPGAKHVATES